VGAQDFRAPGFRVFHAGQEEATSDPDFSDCVRAKAHGGQSHGPDASGED
jgi:hypothetical protein